MTTATVNNNQNTANRVNNHKIEDFGKKIGGARKDYAAQALAICEEFANAASPEALKGCKTLSALVKLPNLETLAKGGAISEDAARAVLTTWRGIERKPTASAYRASRWAQETAPKLARIAALLGGEEITEDEKTAAEFRTLEAAGWPAEAFTFGKYKVKYYVGYSFRTPTAADPMRILSGDYYQGEASTDAAQIVAQLRALTDKDSAKRADGPALAASQNRARRWYIHPEHNQNISIKVMPTGATHEEVRREMNENRAALVERLHALQQFPALRRDSNRPRVGDDWRKGQNITPEEFAKALPFYGVEFGNWVTYTERNILINSAFDGFHDLAQLWGIPAEACALGGSLAFAFGSRGIAGAMAHYEPCRKVINLTKRNGAGCMAHEWLHAVDNWAMYRQGLSGYATEARKDAQSETERAGAALLEAIRNTEFYTRSCKMAEIKGDYWTKGRELAARGFEGVCAFLMKSAGICSDFLVNCISMDDFTAADVDHRSNYYPYPSEAEAATLAPYYFAFLRAIFGECVQMSDKVRAEVDELAQVAQREHLEAEAKRNADEEADEKQRSEVEEAAKDHREAMAEENRQNVEKLTADTMAETGAEWSHVFCSCSKYYAVGGGRGFVFMVYASGHTSYRLTKENNRIKKDFRGARGYIIEYRHGVNLCEAIKEDLKFGFTGICEMYDNFRNTTPSTWEEFKAKHAQELAEAQKPAEEPKGEKVAKDEPQTTTATTSDCGEVLAERDGLQLVTMGDGVAVVEIENRATYRNRKELRANGADWNKPAKQWQAVNPDDVRRLRAWFGLSDEQTTTAEAEPVEDVAVPVEDADTITTQDEPQTEPQGASVAEVGNTTTEEENEPTVAPEEGEAVADYPRYEAGEKSQAANSWAVFSFSVLGVNTYSPEHITDASSEGEACQFIADAMAGLGCMSTDAVEELARGGDWWAIYHSKRDGDIICMFVAPRADVGDLSGALLNAESWNLRERLAACWADAIKREELRQIEKLTDGDEYTAAYKGERVTVRKDANNCGRFVVAWWCEDRQQEQHTNRTAEEAADSVANFASFCIPARIWNRWRNLSRVARYEVPQDARTAEAQELRTGIATLSEQMTKIGEQLRQMSERLEELDNNGTTEPTNKQEPQPTETPTNGEAVEDVAQPEDDFNEYTAGAVWQFDRYHGTKHEELHEIRKREDGFEVVLNIYDRNGNGNKSRYKYATYLEAYEVLKRCRPGSRLISKPEDELRRIAAR